MLSEVMCPPSWRCCYQDSASRFDAVLQVQEVKPATPLDTTLSAIRERESYPLVGNRLH
jgi:hypothetical protein